MTSVNITLEDNINPDELPYHEIFTPQKLREWGVKRFNKCQIVARGDSRSPDEIVDSGGFHPDVTNPNTNPESIHFRTAPLLDVWAHRASSTGSGFVSCTSSMNAARVAAFNTRRQHGRNKDIYVYLVKVTGALGPGVGKNDVIDNEYEHSIAGGIDACDIVAYRKIPGSDYSYEPLLYIANNFIDEYPQLIPKILDQFLQKDESFDDAFKLYLDEHPMRKLNI